MSTSLVDAEPRARSVQFVPDGLTVELKDGRTLTVPLEWFPRLRDADRREIYDASIYMISPTTQHFNGFLNGFFFSVNGRWNVFNDYVFRFYNFDEPGDSLVESVTWIVTPSVVIQVGIALTWGSCQQDCYASYFFHEGSFSHSRP